MALFDSQYSLDQAYRPPTDKIMQPGNDRFPPPLISQPLSALDDSYLRYGPQQQFPEQQLGQYQSSIYGNPLNQQPSSTQSDGDPGLGKTLRGLGLSSLMGQEPQQPQPERPAGASDQDWQGYLSAAEDMSKYRKESGDMGRYVGVGEGGYDRWKNQQVSLAANKEKYGPGFSGLATNIGGVMTNVDKEGNALSPMSPPDILPMAGTFLKTRPGDEGASPMPLPIMPGPVDYDEPETGFKSTLMPPQQTINTSAGPMLPPTPMPNPPVSLPRPTTMPMPGDVGYVPYGSRNNQLVPPGYEKPSFVQGLAGGGPIRNLSFVELLRQTMEN